MIGTADTTLHITRRYEATRDRLFEAFTDPEALKRWYAPVPGWVVSVATVDLQVGGGFHLEFGPAGGTAIVEDGEYLEIERPVRLVYALRLRGRASEDTRVTIEFLDRDGSTEVVVTETGYSSQAVRDTHRAGFTRMLEQLADVV